MGAATRGNVATTPEYLEHESNCVARLLCWLCTTALQPERTCTADEPCCGHEEGENAESLHGAMERLMPRQFVSELLVL